MPTSDTNKVRHSLPGLNEHPTAGNAKATVPTGSPSGHPAPTARNQKRRRTKPPEDVDSDYAEEAEDFFYGEGM
jgi:hypothetical protein